MPTTDLSFVLPSSHRAVRVRRSTRLLVALTAAAGATTLGLVGHAAPARAATSSAWDSIAACESGGNWSTNTGNGYSGGLQFSASTWSAYGGGAYSPTAAGASKAAQIAVATRVQAAQGWGAWPVCSRKAGVRGAAPAAVVPEAHVVTRSPATAVHRPAAATHRSVTVHAPARTTAHAAAPARAAAPVRAAAPAHAAPTGAYLVTPGDTLVKIAAAHHVAGGWRAVWAANRATIADPTLIFVGQHLQLP